MYEEVASMDFVDQLRALVDNIPELVQNIKTEEATKSGLVMPFIKALGYDVFNPLEVVPEFTADIGERKGEKVDYAVLKDGKPIMLFECKICGSELATKSAIQLQRYFQSVPEVKFGILTDGIRYRFFSDLDRVNVMDSKPFFEVDLLNLEETTIEELRRFSKPAFDAKDILSTAGELKYTREIKSLFRTEFFNPSRNFVKLLATTVYDGHFTKKVHERFTPIVKRAFRQFINERINETLEAAKTLQQASVGAEAGEDKSETAESEEQNKDNGIVTTAEELQGYYIVKAILSDIIDLTRVTMRDVKSYCGILLDNNRRKPLCRLHFNNPRQKYIELFDVGKTGSRHRIERLDDIYQFADRLKTTVKNYDAARSKEQSN